MEPNTPRSDEIELGSVVGTFSFRGEVRLFLHNPDSPLLRDPKLVVLVSPDGARLQRTMSTRPGAGGRVIGRISGVTDEAGATALRGYRVFIHKDLLPALSDNEYYVWQLEGCAVWVDGVQVGRVVGVQEAGPHEILEIEVAGESQFVPLRAEFVRAVDVGAARIDLVAGALEEEPE